MKKINKVGDLVKFHTKGITPKYVPSSNVMVLNQKCIRNNKIDYSFAQYTEDAKEIPIKKIVREGDIIINSTGQGTAGRCAFVDKLPKGVTIVTDSHMLLLRCNSYYEAQCLSYNLYYFEESIQSFIDGSTGQGELDKVRLFNLQIALPLNSNMQEQAANLLYKIDIKIELNNRINAELEEIAKTLYDYWFVQLDFPDKNGNPYKTSGGKMVWNEVLKREIPEGWSNGLLSDIGNIIGGSTPPKDISEYFSSKGTPWITPKDLSLNIGNKFITRGEIDVSEKGMKAASLKIMPKGTVLMSSRAPIGYMAIANEPVTTNQGFKSFVPKSYYSTPFVFYTIKNSLPRIISNASGSTFKEISGGTLKTIKMCLPTKSIIEKYTSIVTSVFERQNIVEQENQQLSQLRNWLLPMLMNGQIRIE